MLIVNDHYFAVHVAQQHGQHNYSDSTSGKSDRSPLLKVDFFGATAPSGPGPPHSRGFYITHDDTPHSVGLVRTSDRPVAETST